MVVIVLVTPTLTHLQLEKWTFSIGIKEVGEAKTCESKLHNDTQLCFHIISKEVFNYS